MSAGEFAGFDRSELFIIEFLIDCGMRKAAAETYMAYLRLLPRPKVDELEDFGIAVLRANLGYKYAPETIELSIEFLAEHGFLDNMTPDHVEATIRRFIDKKCKSAEKRQELLDRLPEVMAKLGDKLEAYGRERRKHYLHEPSHWAISKESKQSFLKALEDANDTIKLAAYSGETFLEGWKTGDLLIAKLKQGVSVRILFIHPDLSYRIEGKPQPKPTIDMTKRFFNRVQEAKHKLKEAGLRGFGDLQIRWVRKEEFGHFRGLLTYVQHDPVSHRTAVARLNIHCVGRERGTIGIIVSSDNSRGDTTLFKILETYFDEAWRRAEPLAGFGLWTKRLVRWVLGFPGIFLTAVIIALLVFVSATVANALFFVYTVILAAAWRHGDIRKIWHSRLLAPHS